MKPHAEPSAESAHCVAHRAARESLPWLLNGSLDGAELDAVAAHLRVCADCRQELEMLRALRAAARDGAGPACDPERALARLLPRLDAAPPATPEPAVPGLLQGWRGRLAANERSWLRGAVLAQGAALAALLVLLVQPGVHDDTYRTLGANARAQARLVVVFRPDTSECELRRIVRAGGMRIVDGPTVTDAYLLDAGGDLGPTLARLRAEPAVRLAEALGPERRP